jgi:hypothetical protein
LVRRRGVAIAMVHVTRLGLHSVCPEEDTRQLCSPMDTNGHARGRKRDERERG